MKGVDGQGEWNPNLLGGPRVASLLSDEVNGMFSKGQA